MLYANRPRCGLYSPELKPVVPPCKEHGKGHGKGICAAVVDDENNRVYLYGNVIHENYHIPGSDCMAWCAVASDGFVNGRLGADEFFDGVQENNTIVLEHKPINDRTMLVFLNGIKQREGNEYDYTVNGKAVHFNFYSLLPSDRVEINYTYGAE